MIITTQFCTAQYWFQNFYHTVRPEVAVTPKSVQYVIYCSLLGLSDWSEVQYEDDIWITIEHLLGFQAERVLQYSGHTT